MATLFTQSKARRGTIEECFILIATVTFQDATEEKIEQLNVDEVMLLSLYAVVQDDFTKALFC